MRGIKQVSESFVNAAIETSRINPIFEWWDVPYADAMSLDLNDPFMDGVVVSMTHGTVGDKLHYFVKTIRWP